MKKIISALVFSFLIVGIQPVSAGGTYWQDGDYERICLTLGWTDCAVWKIVDKDGNEKNRVIGPGSLVDLTTTCGSNLCGGGESATAVKLETLAPIATPTPTPTPTNSAPSTNAQINVGIWLISGRTSEIYGRGDGIADSQNQIQWVTCLESPSSPMIYPNRDNLNYTYTVTGPAGVVATGDYKPTWIDSMSSCTGNSGGNQYTVAYNLTGLAAGTSYQFTVTGSNAGTSFTSSKSFTTMAAPSVSPTNPSTSVETKTATTPIVTPETSTPISTPTSSVAPVQVSDTATSSSAPAPSSVVTPAPAPSPTPSSTPAPISAPAPTSETQSAVAPVVPIAPTSTSETDSGLDEVEAEEEIIDSIVAVVQSNGTTRIEVSTGYTLTAMTVVATKKGSKKKYTYRITTNADGDRKFKSGLNLRGFTVILYKGTTELDRMYIS